MIFAVGSHNNLITYLSWFLLSFSTLRAIHTFLCHYLNKVTQSFFSFYLCIKKETQIKTNISRQISTCTAAVTAEPSMISTPGWVIIPVLSDRNLYRKKEQESFFCVRESAGQTCSQSNLVRLSREFLYIWTKITRKFYVCVIQDWFLLLSKLFSAAQLLSASGGLANYAFEYQPKNAEKTVKDIFETHPFIQISQGTEEEKHRKFESGKL